MGENLDTGKAKGKAKAHPRKRQGMASERLWSGPIGRPARVHSNRMAWHDPIWPEDHPGPMLSPCRPQTRPQTQPKHLQLRHLRSAWQAVARQNAAPRAGSRPQTGRHGGVPAEFNLVNDPLAFSGKIQGPPSLLIAYGIPSISPHDKHHPGACQLAISQIHVAVAATIPHTEAATRAGTSHTGNVRTNTHPHHGIFRRPIVTPQPFSSTVSCPGPPDSILARPAKAVPWDFHFEASGGT